MTAKVTIIDGTGSGQYAGVSDIGEVLIAGFGSLLNKSEFRVMNSTTKTFNFFGPIIGQQFLITSILISGNASSTITIYEATSASTLIADKIILQINLRANSTIIIPFSFGGFLPVSEGEYLNAITDTQPVNMNIVGYYYPTIRSSIVS
jgi:hypothetical protein